MGSPVDPALDDPLAFGRVYDEHAAIVYRTAFGVLGDRQAAEDVTQEVFLRLWRHPDGYDARRGSLSGYLRMMGRSRAVDAWRTGAAAGRATRRLEAQAAAALPPEDPAAGADRALVAPVMRTAVGSLPDEQREAVVLAYWGGLSASEIAGRSDVPLGTVKSRLRLALRRLREDGNWEGHGRRAGEAAERREPTPAPLVASPA
jgi:RNA polymerase sigma-70 factor, ECF subfamily